MVGVERGFSIKSMDSPDKLEPQGILEAVRPTRDEGLASQTLGMIHAESGSGNLNIDYIIPYVVTQVSRDNSPFYLDSESIGLEDKVMGREDILGEKDSKTANSMAPYSVAEFFSQRGAKILDSMEKLHSEEYAARARALVRSGKMAPATSPQGAEDMRIIGHLEQSLAAFVRELNSNITPDADNFRQEIYAKLGTKDPTEVLNLYKKGLINVGVKKDHGYPKRHTGEILERMSPNQRISWEFMRDLVRTLSDPEFRTSSKKFAQTPA